MVAGAVLASTAAATHMAAKAVAPMPSRTGSSVNTSEKTNTLSAMLTIGSTMTIRVGRR